MASISKRIGPQGVRWEVRIRKAGFRSLTKTFYLKADADAWASETERSLQKGLIQPVSLDQNATLADLLERYGREITINKRGKSVEIYRLSKIGRHQISAIPLSRLKSFHLIDYRNQRLDEVSSTTVRKELALIAHVLKIGEIEWGYHFLSNPMDPVRKPSENPQRMRRLQPGEERLLLSSCRTSQNRWLSSVVLIAIETAMRRGELLGLEWAKIDLVNRTAHLPMTKNGSGRTISLSTTAVETLESLPRDITGKVFPISRTALRGFWNRASISNVISTAAKPSKKIAPTRWPNGVSWRREIRIIWRFGDWFALD